MLERLGEDVVNDVLDGKKEVVNSKFAFGLRFSGTDNVPACGGGLSAAINWLSLKTLGVESRLYDEVRMSHRQLFTADSLTIGFWRLVGKKGECHHHWRGSFVGCQYDITFS